MIKFSKEELQTAPKMYFGYDKDDPNRDKYRYIEVDIPRDYAGNRRYARINCMYAWTLDFYKLFENYLQDERNKERWAKFHYDLRKNEPALICINFGIIEFGGHPFNVYRNTIGSTPEFGKILDVLQYTPFYELPFDIYAKEDVFRKHLYGLQNRDFKKFIFLEEGETLPSCPAGNYMIQVLA